MNLRRAPTRQMSSNRTMPVRKLSKTFSSVAKTNFLGIIDRAMEGYLETKVADLESGKPIVIEEPVATTKKDKGKKKKDQPKKPVPSPEKVMVLKE